MPHFSDAGKGLESHNCLHLCVYIFRGGEVGDFKCSGQFPMNVFFFETSVPLSVAYFNLTVGDDLQHSRVIPQAVHLLKPNRCIKKV